jgi:ribosomal protein S25
LYNLYQRSEQEKWEFNNDDEMMSHLVQISDEKIDAIISEDKERVVSRDALIPALCYDLLLENAELRKMANACQLKILVFYKGSIPAKKK